MGSEDRISEDADAEEQVTVLVDLRSAEPVYPLDQVMAEILTEPQHPAA